jgi:hypothetical protein
MEGVAIWNRHCFLQSSVEETQIMFGSLPWQRFLSRARAVVDLRIPCTGKRWVRRRGGHGATTSTTAGDRSCFTGGGNGAARRDISI